MRCKKIEEDLD